MNRAWLFILSVGLLLPLRWLPNAMSRPAGFMIPFVATAVMVTCGELVLNNPTVSPAGPYCPGDVIDITFTGSNLPDGEDLEVFIGDNSGYNPFSGGGTSIGTIPIGYNCSTCPSLLGLTVNVCLNDDENEFMLIHSGCGFDVSDLFVDLLPVGLSANDLGSVNGCPFMQPSASVMAALQSNTDCSNLNVIAAGDGDAIPPAALVIVFMTDTGPFIDYDISYLCGTGLPIYVIQNSCDLGISGAFSNSSCPRTYSIDIAGSCYDAITYQCPIQDPPGGGHSFIDENGAWYTSPNCDDPPFSSLNYPDISNDLASLSYTIPTNICGANNGLMNFYLSGIVDITGPCEDLIYTPPSGSSISVACPATIDPAGPFCVNNGQVTLTTDEPGGTWTGTGIVDANNGIFDPGVAGSGTHTISYDAGCPGGPSTIDIIVNDGPEISEPISLYFFVSATTCAGDSSGQIVNAAFVTGGTSPYTYDWDAQSTPGNDVYPDDGNMFIPHSLANVPAGFYDFIVTDAAGCADTVTIEVTEGDPVTAVLEIDSILCYGQSTGGIDIVSSNGPPVPPVYNWDDLSTPGDDNFGGPPAVDDDMEDISGLPAGSYAITITYEDPGFFECVFIDTIVIPEPPELMVTAPDSLINCFGNTVDITAVATGGTGNYTYNWSNIGGSNNPATNTNIGVGSYIVTVTDENGCTGTDVSTITQPPLLTASATGETIDCDDNTGDITLVIMGGTGPFLFDWDNDGTGDNDDPQNLSGLNSGTYSVTVTDANGCTAVASADIDLNPTTFMMPPDDGSTVPCISDAQTVPVPPVVLNSCNDPLTITGPVVSSDPTCSGIKTYTYTYTDPFTGNMATWVYTYTISPPTFSLPANGSSTVACILDAQTVPTPPPTTDNCGEPLTISGPVVDPDPVCSGTKTYTWDYSDCSGTTAQWVYTYTISPPTFTIPAAGGSTVPCVSDAQTVPTPPMVSNSCGDALTMTGPVIGSDPVCSGTKTYTWDYMDCTGSSGQWVYTYTVDPSTFSLPADGGSTVACIIDAQTVPTPPVVNNSCGDPLTVTGPVVGPDPVCSGTKTYTWDYENCDGTSSPWVYTYTISPPTFSLPANGSSTVACISDAQTVPTPPMVNNSCGDPITPTGPVVTPDPMCSGDKTYTWTYTDCTGTSADWVYTYTISPPTFSLPANDGSTVPCIGDAQTVPTPPAVTNSCGATITPTGPVVGPDPVCSGDKTYTWTYTDCTGTSADWVYTYTVQPTTFTLPADGGSNVACISDAQTVPTPPAVINSCGDPVVPSGPVAGPDPVCSGDKTYTFTYTDCDGNDFPWVYTYTVDPPTFSLPAAGGSTVACVADAQTVPTPPVVNNSCGDALTITGPVVGPDPSCTGVKTYTFTYTDCTGTSADWVYTYTVDPPTFTLPGGGSSTVPCVSDAQTVPTPPVVNNSCGDALTITGPVVGPDPVCSGTKTYTWDYTDCTGSSGQWVYTYTIDPSTFSLPADGGSTVACISDAQTVPTPPVVTNSCGDPLTINGPVVGPDPVCSGIKTYTWDYENCDGSTLPWVYTYTINPPTFSLPANGSSTVACISDAQTVPTPPTVNNSCGDPITPTGPVVGPDPVCSGDKTYTWTYTDCTGTSADWVYTYTVDPPTFTLPANDGSSVPCIGDAQTVPTPPTVNNSCGDAITPTGPVVGPDPVCSGDKTYTWTYTDCTGTSADWVYTYMVQPTTFTLPADDGSNVACISDAQTVPTPPVVINSCGDPVSPTGPVVGPDPVCSGDKIYTFTYTDCDGNDFPWVYTYTVDPPTFTLPADGASTVACISDAQTVPTPPAVNNSCGDALTISGPVVGTDPVCTGDKTYTWTYTDCTGTSADWVYTYTVDPPTFTLPAAGGSTVPCVSDAQTVPTPPTVNNSCGDALTITGPVVGPDPVCSGTKTYTWDYTDCTGTSGQWVYTYTIDPSTFSLPADGSSTVACISDAQTVPTPPVVTNSCGDPLTVSGPVVGPDPVCSGTKTYTWDYENCDGSTLPWVYTYTIDPPTFTVPADGSSTVACISDAQAVPTPPTVNNSCGDPITPTGPVVGPDPVCSGDKTYTWTYTDCTGTSADWVYTYTVDPPTFTLPADDGSNVVCVSDAQTVPTPPTVNNSCGDAITPTGPVVGPDPVCSGDKTYTWTYTDCTGTSADWVYTYTVDPSTFTLPADDGSTVACISDAQVVPTPPAVINSCGDPVVPTGPVAGPDPVCSGDKTYTWTYTDCDGNDFPWVYTYTVDPPTFTLPAAGGSTVACVSDAQTVPTPPVVNNSCGDALTISGPVVGADPVCSGDKTYTWTYTDCTGTSADWVYTYTVDPPTFTLPAAGGSTVACVSDAQTVPMPPVVNNSCGDALTISGPVVGADPVCSGDKTYTWTYTDCTGTSGDWVYTYTVDPSTFTLPADGGSTVACISDAQTVPTPPVVTNSCGDPLTVSGPVVGPDPVCSGIKTYTWDYENCDGSTLPWVYTYTIDPPTFTLPADGSSTVACISDAQVVPTPPTVNNSCGDPITPTGPVVGPDPVCSGDKTYTWTYTDCTGTAADWVYTYTVDPPTFTLPADDGSNVVCVSDAQTVPTPPAVNNSCGDPITPTGPVVGPDPVCSGDKTYTWTYTDCTGTSADWVYTYTVDPSTFTLPADDGSTVACISDAQVVPTPPAVINSCGDPVVPTGPVVGADPVCTGDKTYTWTYTDCDGNDFPWVYTYTVDPPTFTLPADDGSTVACVSDAQTVPTPPVVNNSCGDALTISGPVVGPDPVCTGDKTYTWTYTDCTGTSADWVYTYTVDPPTFTLPANDGSTVPCVSDAQTVPTPPVVNNSCGDALTITGPVVGADPVCSGDKIYTWTYTDCTGTSADWVYTYTVDPSTFTLPADGSSTVACISDAQTVPTPPVVTNSCGDPLTITGPVVGPDPVCSGTKTYTWDYANCDGSTLPWVFTYTIDPPTFTLPADDGSNVACISDAQTVPTPPVVNNSCGDPITPTGPVVGPDPVCSGDKTYTWTYTDCTGTSADWVYTYTVDPPTFTLPADDGSNVPCISDAQTVPTPPTVNNSCGDVLTPTGPVVGPDPVCSGDKTYTWTYTDCTGTSADWVYTYTIDPSTFTLPADDGSTVACISDAQTVPTPPAVINSCGDPVTPTGPVVSPDPVCSGDKTYTWTYTDCDGNDFSWVYTYTVDPPTFTLPADNGSTVACISDAQTVPTPPVVNNSCGDPITPTGPVVGADPVCSGDKTYTWTYTDCTGTSADWVYTYTVDPPTFTLPADDGSTVACVSDAQTVPTPPAVNNSCGDPLTISGPVVGPDPVCSGDKTYTWTFTDCTGTSADWVYTYTVDPSTFTLPANDGSTVACISDAQVVPTPPVVNNSCGDPLTVTGPVVGPDPVCSGDKTYTWTYTDCSGASSDWVYTYTVDPPTFTLPADDGSNVACISDAQTVPTPPVVNNSCGDPLTVTGPVVGADPVCSGDKTYTWTYTDCTGTSADWVYTYTVDPPTFTLPADDGSNVQCISDAQTVPTPPVVNNSCGDPITPTGPVVGPDPVCSGDKTYTWTYTDCTGTSADWVYTYTIDPSTFTLPADDGSNVPCISDAQTVPTPPAVINSCGDPVVPTGPVVGPDPVCSGDKTYTWTYTDCAGTDFFWVYTYTVDPPTSTLPADDGSTVACISDAQTVPTPPSVDDSCGNPITPTGPVVGPDPVCSGDKTYTWTYTDCTGASADWVYTYTVDPPTFTLPADDGSTVACVSDAQVEPVPPVVNNSCGDPLTISGPTIGPDPVCSGTKTYTWDYTDCTGTSAQWVYTYTVDPSSFSLPPDDGSTVACISDAQVEPIPPVVTNSCGDPLTISGPTVSPDPVCSGDKTYTWDYTNCDGSSSAWVYTYTIDPPAFTLPADDGSTVACVSDAQVQPTPPVVNDSCGDPVTPTGPVVGSDPVCSGDKTYTWTYTDCTGATADWVYTYTVDPPTFTLPADDGAIVPCIVDAQVEPVPPVVTNSCGDDIIPTGPVAGVDPVCSGDKTYTWTYTDCDGSSLDWTYTYTITGDTGPVFTAPPADTTVDCVADIPPMISLSYTNDCSPGGMVAGTDSPISGSCPATITRTWTFTDACGNVGTVTQDITIDDTTPPTASDPASIIVAVCNDPVPAPDISVVTDAADNCSAPVVAFDSDVTDLVGCTETTTRTFTVTDACNNSITVTQLIIRTVDTDPPVFTNPPGDLSVECLIQVPPMDDLDYTDNCSADGTVIGTETGPSGDPLTIIREWTITDDCGNVTTHTQTITINEVINETNLTPVLCDGDIYTLPDGSTTSIGGMYGPYLFTASNGCDSTVNVDLTFIPNSSGDELYTGCQGDGYSVVVNGTTYDESNPTGMETITGSNGCDSIVTIDLTFNMNTTGEELYTGCEGDGYSVIVNGTTYDEFNPMGTETLMASNGCDSVVTIDLTFNPPSTGEELYTGCEGDGYSVDVNGTTYDESNPIGTEVLTGANGCDSTVTITLVFQPAGTGEELYTGCIGDGYSVVVNGTLYDESNPDGIETFPGSGGCDSTVTIDLDFNAVTTGEELYTGCEGDGYAIVVDGTTYDETNPTGTETLMGSNGCDSVVTIDLTFHANTTGEELYAGCEGDGYFVVVNGTTYDELNPFGTEVLLNANGCDSTVTIDLTFAPAGTGEELYTGCEGDGYFVVVNGTTYDESNPTGTETFPGQNGCDSTVTINLTFALPSSGDELYAGCEGDGYSVVVNGTTYDESNPNGVEVLTGSNGCDSIVTIDLSFSPALNGEELYNGCEGDGYSVVVNGNTYDESNPDGLEILVSSIGCDSIVVIDLDFNPITMGDELYSGCEGDGYSVVINGTTYDESNPNGTEVITGANGCDSIVTIDLTFAPASSGEELYNGCEGDGYAIVVNGTTYDESNPNGTETFPGPNGCDSTVTINLIYSPPSSGEELYNGCEGDGYSVIVNGTTYDESNPNGTEILTGANGCDSTVNIMLTFMPNLEGEELYSGCEGDGYSVVVNGTTYDESNPTGMETITGAGCDSVVTIDLTFLPFVEAEISPAGPYCTSAGVMTLVAVPAGGTWSGDVSSDQFDPAALGTGNFQVIYTSPAGACQTADTIYIDVYELEISCEVLADESAPDAFDGRGQVTVTGGVPPYTISWSGPMSGSDVLNADGPFMITGLTGGVYTVEVEDATGCIATCEFTIMTPVPCDLMIDAPDIVDATCPGVNNGSILVNVTGTMPPFEYSLDGVNYDPNNFFDQLMPGNYTIYVIDDAGCEETLDVVVGVGAGPELMLEGVEDASCGLDNGSIEVSASGGSTPYTYSIDGSTYGLSNQFPGLAPGEYLVYLIDDAGCTDTIPVDVNSTDSPVINDIIIAGSSCGQSDGGITIDASGGLGMLMYSINGGGSFQASNIFTGLPAGNYPIVVEDEAGCQVTGNAMITDVGGPMIDNVVVDPAGCGLFNGVITVTASGVPTLMYSLNAGTLQSSNVFSNLLPGNYTLLVQDGNGCEITQQVTVTTTDGPVINSLTPTHTTCDEENGEIAISWSGGTGGIEIFIDGDSYGDQSPITDLPAGTYTVEILDDNGCSASNTVTINPSEAPDFDVYITPANCGLANGVIELDGFDGTPPYTYSINNGPFTSTFTFVNRISDFYIMQIKDANGCIYEEEVFLWEAPGPEITNIITTNPPCGSTAGMIEVITNPATDLEYSINVPTYQDSNKFVNVTPGTYTVTIKDEFGCTDTGTATIEATPSPEVSAVVVDTECGSSTGSITASATMGVAPYTYALNNGPFGAGNVFSNLTAGTYTVKAMGANGCIDSLVVDIISVGTQYGALSDEICEGDVYMLEGESFTETGEYEVDVPGGASDGCDSIVVLTLTVNPYVPKEIFEAICEGDVYTYNGMDYSVAGTYDLDTLPAAVGCDTLLSLNLTVNPLETTYLDETICFNGVYTINGMDYTDPGEYLIDTIPAAVGCDSIRILRLMVDPINESTIDSSICEGDVVTIGGMDYNTTGFYEIDTVAGPDGCDTIIYLDLEVNPLPTADAGADKILDCAMQTVTLDGSGTGGSPLWTGPGIDASNETQFTPEVSVPGLYILTVTSGTNCVAVDSVVVDQDPDVVIANAGLDDSLSCDVTEITLQASPTGNEYTYLWTGPGIDGSNENLQNPVIDEAGTYTLVVTNTLTGCVSAPDQVVISDISVVLIAIIQDPNNLTCFIDTVNLSSIGSSTGPNIVYAWFDGEGELISSTPGFEITSGGLFVLVVEDTISGCFGSDSVFVEDLTQYPVVDAGPPQVIDCNNSTVILNEGATNTNDNLIFQWIGPAGGIIGADSLISALAGLPGEYFLVATDTVNSCQNLDSVMVIDMTTPPIADINLIEPITCIDESALMDIGSSSTGADITQIWSGPDLNNFVSTTLETTVPGEYYLDVINEATGCAARDTVVILPPDIPTAMAAEVTTPNCAGDPSGTITVTDVTGGTPPYMYSLNGGPLQSENIFEDLFAGNYTVQVVDANGCTISDTYFIEDGQEFTIDIGPDIFLELGDSVTLSADISLPWPLIDSLVWTPADILSCTLCPNPVLYGLHTAAVTATVYSGGCIDQDMLIVRVDVDADIYIPNVFSPNDDGINDKVTVYTDYRVRRVVYFEIFDRWGNQVFVATDFQPNDPNLGWDGTFKGKLMNPAVFAYTAKVELLNGQTLSRKGDITLLR